MSLAFAVIRILAQQQHADPLVGRQGQRREDIEPLAQHILQKIGGANPPELTPSAIDALSSYSWTGNVRQLRNCLERAVLLCDNGEIKTKDLPPEVVHRIGDQNNGVSVSYNIPRQNGANGFHNSAPSNLKDVERQQIITALEQTGWHRGKTAELLGISPSTLYRRLREYELDV